MRDRTSAELAVKKFSRYFEKDPARVRTRGALARAMAHLLSLVDDGAPAARGASLASVHKFLWDRFRGVRQDLQARPADFFLFFFFRTRNSSQVFLRFWVFL